jgi:transglutaminase-like putative cysteine protease
MRLRIEHNTRFDYSEIISEAYTELRLKPLDDDHQRALSFSLQFDPRDQLHFSYADRYGNDVQFIDIVQPHQSLIVTSLSEVLTTTEHLDRSNISLSPLDEFDYHAPSQYAVSSDALTAFGNQFHGADAREAALALMSGVHSALKYTKGATQVSTTADDALKLGQGVCQDYSHIMISACRARGIAARYVSGYLFTRGMEGNNFDDAATHAWVDVLIPDQGWLSLDPTHNMPQGERHVRLAIGRDYADVPPTRGIYKGNAQEKMQVGVVIRSV